MWGNSTPNILHLQPLHSDYATASCRFTIEFLLAPIFFETLTTQGPKICSATSEWYRELLHQQVTPALQERQYWQTTILVQHGATLYSLCQVKAQLNATFGNNHVISRHFPDAWLSCSFDLNPCDFWFRGLPNDHVYI
ncbi:uncharacterized protein TNCV_3004411 [Trichonephila clavipes]|nr:uncharacterized protein TNCV_3004411 [Trichonephila clavipes]